MAGRWSESDWPAYVSVGERRKKAEKEIAALRKKGRTITPVVLEGSKITRTFWGKAWCDNLESYSDYANRLARGRSYVRNGSIMHLEVGSGKIEAMVRGTRTYTVTLAVTPLAPRRWSAVIDDCSGQVASLVELLEGKLSRGVMEVVTDVGRGIFPSPKEISLSCSCPDWATMCKHVAATLYGVGARLDDKPELLFLLRGVDPTQLVARSVGRAATKASASRRGRAIEEDALGAIFGIEIDAARAPVARKMPVTRRAPEATKKLTKVTKRTKTKTKTPALTRP
jgi:uncharacterized Zn finger protein